MEADNCRVTPAASHKTSNTSLSLFNSLKRRDSKKQGAGGSTKSSRHFQASRPPPGFVSYQIPNGAPPVIPSDNIVGYDPRSKYSASAASLGGRSQSRSRSEAGPRGHQSHAPTAGVHPNHLHNGGRPYKSAVRQSPGVVQPPPQYTGGDDHTSAVIKSVTTSSPPGYAPPPPPWSDNGQEDSALHIYNATPRSSHKYTGEGGKKYRKSPVPVLKSPIWVQEPDDLVIDGSPDYYGRPPLPPGDSDPKPPPRSRPKSWTSTIFNAFRNGGSRTQTMTPLTQDMRERENSTVTLSSVNTSTMDKKSYRFTKQVRFLANPKKSLVAGQKFYSLPHFSNKPVPVPGPEKTPEPEKKVVTKSRSPSPFGRFVKSFVKGNRGKSRVNLNISARLQCWQYQKFRNENLNFSVVCRCVAWWAKFESIKFSLNNWKLIIWQAASERVLIVIPFFFVNWIYLRLVRTFTNCAPITF